MNSDRKVQLIVALLDVLESSTFTIRRLLVVSGKRVDDLSFMSLAM